MSVLYPIFMECCLYTRNRFWESVFECLAYGKPPHGTYISHGALCCSLKGREFAFKFLDMHESAETVHEQVVDLLVDKVGLRSRTEHASQRRQMHHIERSVSALSRSWRNVKKNGQDMLLELYVLGLRERHHMTMPQAATLLAALHRGLALKTIMPRDIDYDGRCVRHVHGVTVDANGDPRVAGAGSPQRSKHGAHADYDEPHSTGASSSTVPDHIRHAKPRHAG